MELLKVTQEYRVDTEEEAKEALESFRRQADEKGYTLKSAGYTLKEKKSKGEVIDRYKRYIEESLKINPEFKAEFDKMVDACMEYDEVFLGCYCSLNESCHADYIIQRLRQECTKRMIQNALKNKLNADF